MNEFVDILGVRQVFDCLGCDIANHKLVPPGGYAYDDGFINVSADPEIPIKGFMVLGVSKHVKSINDFSEEESLEIFRVLKKSIKVMKEALEIKEILIVQEEKAGHFHIWFVPIHDWMSQFGKKVQNIDKIINYAKEHFDDEAKKELLEAIEKIKKGFES